MAKNSSVKYPFSGMPNLAWLADRKTESPVPDDAACFALWNKYKMFDNVREHSLAVACIATALAEKAALLGFPIDAQAVRASALLHDIAKSWCIQHGGSHAMLGASWTVSETGNYKIAQGIILHVHWPWILPKGAEICKLPFLVMYADKRIKHSRCVSLSERYEDLLVRYGKTDQSRAGIRATWEQAKKLEQELSEILEWKLNEYTFDCGRLVH